MANEYDDATRAALERVARNGADLNRPLEIDFFVAVPDETGGRLVAERAEEGESYASIEQEGQAEHWTPPDGLSASEVV